MKIQITEDTNFRLEARAGEVIDIGELCANILIRRGKAVPYDDAEIQPDVADATPSDEDELTATNGYVFGDKEDTGESEDMEG